MYCFGSKFVCIDIHINYHTHCSITSYVLYIFTNSVTSLFSLSLITLITRILRNILGTSKNPVYPQVLRSVAERKAFFAPVVHTVLAHRLEKIDFSVVYEMSPISFSMATPILKPRWEALYYPLSTTVWGATILALLSMPVCFYIVSDFCNCIVSK